MGLESESVAVLPWRKAIMVTAGTSVGQAAALMKRHSIGCVFVIDAAGVARGIFTEGCLLRVLANNPDGVQDAVSRHLAHHCYTIHENDSVAQLIQLMHTHDLRFVGVVDNEGRLVGLTGQKGLMEYVAQHYPSQILVAKVGHRLSLQREGA